MGLWIRLGVVRLMLVRNSTTITITSSVRHPGAITTTIINQGITVTVLLLFLALLLLLLVVVGEGERSSTTARRASAAPGTASTRAWANAHTRGEIYPRTKTRAHPATSQARSRSVAACSETLSSSASRSSTARSAQKQESGHSNPYACDTETRAEERPSSPSRDSSTMRQTLSCSRRGTRTAFVEAPSSTTTPRSSWSVTRS